MCTLQQRSTVFSEDAEISVLCEAFVFDIQFPFPRQKYSVSEVCCFAGNEKHTARRFSHEILLLIFGLLCVRVGAIYSIIYCRLIFLDNKMILHFAW